MSDTKKFPAIGLLVVFGVGSATAAVSLTGFGWLMVKQGLTQEAAAPLATAAVCLGSFLSGLLMAILALAGLPVLAAVYKKIYRKYHI